MVKLVTKVFISIIILIIFPITHPQDSFELNTISTQTILTSNTQYIENQSSSDNLSTDLTLFSKIILTINKKGEQKILGDEFNNIPSLVLVNGNAVNLVNNLISLSEDSNTIQLLWDKKFYNCSYMFSDLKNITNIDFSEFYFQSITNMECMFCNNYDLISINFGNLNTSLVNNMAKMFYNCSSLISLNLSNFDFTNVENIDSMFSFSSKLENIFFSESKTTSLQNMDKIFYNCISLKSLDLSNFDTEKINNMEYTFYNCKALSYINISNFNVSKVVNMKYMFYNCINIISINLSNFYSINPINMDSMFSQCTKLNSINFNENNIIYSNSMSYMFYDCVSLVSLNLNYIDTSNVLNMEYMFYGCNKLQSIDLSKFDTSLVTDMNHMFSHCIALTFLNLSNFYFLYDIDMSYMFYNCNSLQYINFTSEKKIYINNMKHMFEQCLQLLSLDLISFETSNVSHMEYAFYNCNKLVKIKNINFNTSSALYMHYMFYNSYSLLNLDLTSFVASKYAITMNNMFENCNSLQYVTFPLIEKLRIGSMEYMFCECHSLISLDLTSFDTSEVTNMSYVFHNCQNLVFLNISNFNTSSVTDMFRMFKLCRKITSIDLSSFDTSRVRYMRAMFCGCNNIISLNLSHFDTSKVTSISFIFEECTSLKYLNIYNFTKTSNMIEYFNPFINTNGFKYCLKENNIFFNGGGGLYNLNNMERDCSNQCYPYEKFYISSSKTCSDDCKSNNMYQYGSQCINSCPKRYKSSSDNICEFLNCSKYYNFQQTDCIDEIPQKYFLNNTVLKTIDKCNIACSKCDMNSTKSSLCISCDNYYYPKINDIFNIYPYIKCYKSIEGYYLDNENSIFKPCYESCQNCDIKGNLTYHNCKACKSNYFYKFIFEHYTYINCYNKCEFYYFYEKDSNEFFCTKELKCPNYYNKLIVDTGQCVKYCNESNNYNYEFKNVCYEKCPNNTKISLNFDNYCDPICNEDEPFEIIESQECVKNCSIYFLYNKICRLNYNQSNLDLILINIQNDLIGEYFNFSSINNNQDIIIEENHNIYTITLEDKNISGFDECDYSLRNYYNIDYNQSIYKLIINSSKESENNNISYEMYYPLYNKNLAKLNKSICNYTCKEEKCLLCTQRSLSYDLCVSCNDNYYPIFNESFNIYSYINCYKDPEKYYLDINDSTYKQCYYTCQKCNISGNNETHNCISCDKNYPYSYNYNCYNNCDYYFYYDNEKEKYFCTEKLECPQNFSKLISLKRQCIEECYNDDIYKYEYKEKCYEKCPNGTDISQDNYYYCEPLCSKELPFKLIKNKECVESCSINELYNKSCYLKYDNKNIIPILISIENNLISEYFSFTKINNNKDIIIEEEYAIITISLENKNISGLEKCDYILKDYYNISYNQNIYKVIINSTEKNEISYEMFFNLNGLHLEKLNTSLCNYSCKEEKCLICSQKSDFYNICISCNKNYYPILNDFSNIYSYINCYQNPEGYYLDINDSIYKSCYNSCKTCYGFGNNDTHNCAICKNKFIYEIDYQNYSNCYENCSYYFYFDKELNKLLCTEKLECPKKYDKLILEKNQCIDNCIEDDIYKYELGKKCVIKCPSNTEENNYFCNIKCTKEFPFELIETQECISSCSIIERQKKICRSNYIEINNDTDSSKTVQDAAIENIKEGLTGEFNTSDIDKGENIVIEEEGSTITITTTENQKDGETNKNESTINLGQCEIKLKEYYKIPINNSLYILKLDVVQKGMKIPKIEYEVYYPLYGKNLEKLDLTICEDTKIDISIPAELDENIDKLNTSSGYFNDICYTYTSENGTDISLTDRKKEFIENNKTLCEENCEFTRYDYETKKAVCSCNIKINLPLMSDIVIDKNKLYQSFTDIKNIANLKIMKCYNTLFTKEGFSYNYGSYILIPIIFFHFISLFLVCFREIKTINNIIEDIINAKQHFKTFNKKFIKVNKSKKKETEVNCFSRGDNNRRISMKLQSGIKLNNNNKNKKKKSKIFEINKRKGMSHIQLETKNNPPNKIKTTAKDKISNINNINSINLNLTNNNIRPHLEMNNDKVNKSQAKNYINILKYNDKELNSLAYKEAIKKDKRTYIQYYTSLLKIKHLLFFSFVSSNDYNSKIIKIDLFFINFTIYYTINALFFNDDTMHKINEDCGNFNIIYQIPQILYSSLISGILFSVVKLLALSENIVLGIKLEKNMENMKTKEKKGYYFLKIKFFLFFLISFALLILFFYYLACFCAVYKNTQLHLIKDSVISFGLSLIYPFFIYLLPGIFRIPALRAKNKKRENMYKFSQFIQML